MTLAGNKAAAWYHQPVLWLGVAVFAASLIGCAVLIVAGARYADPPLPDIGKTVLKVPVAHPSTPEQGQ